MNRKSLTTVAIVIGVLLATLALGNQPGIEIKSLPPQGLYDSCAPADAECQGHLDKMAGAGFKLIINYGVFDYDVADIKGYADHANAVGMKVIWDVRDGTFDRDYIRERVDALKTHATTWGYYIADEPSVALITDPTDGMAVSGTITAQAWSFIHPQAGTFASIQFLLDGNNLGREITARSSDDLYTVDWDTTQAYDGPHLIQARVLDNHGITATSEPVYVVVDNGGLPTLLRITTTNLPSAQTGVSYWALVGVTGGTPPYSWRISSGSLPRGLSLEPSTGVISGIPSQVGQWPFTIEVQDSASLLRIVAMPFEVNISDTPLTEEQGLVRSLSDFVHEIDPAHPRFLVHFDAGGGDSVSALRPFVDAADVIALDKYTLANDELSETVATSTATLRRFTESKGKQWGFVLQSFNGAQYPGGMVEGWPSIDRMRAERDMVLAGNPAFILWYSYFDILNSPDPAGHWADLVNAAFSVVKE